MLDHDDLKWTAANLTDLNRRLQQVSRYTERARQERADSQYLQLLNDEVEQASKTSQAIFDRITARILSGTESGATAREQTIFRVMPPASAMSAPPSSVIERIPVGEMKIRNGADAGIDVRNPAGRGELILVVDDEPAILERASHMLEQEDYRVVLAKDGFEALQVYGRLMEDVSLVILDFFLPVMDGDAVFDELKAINPDVQVVLSSGFGEQTKLGSMLARGLCGFIPKPYTGEKLVDQVRSIIAA